MLLLTSCLQPPVTSHLLDLRPPVTSYRLLLQPPVTSYLQILRPRVTFYFLIRQPPVISHLLDFRPPVTSHFLVLQPPVTSFLLRLNTPLGTLFLYTLNLCSSLNATDHISLPYEHPFATFSRPLFFLSFKLADDDTKTGSRVSKKSITAQTDSLLPRKKPHGKMGTVSCSKPMRAPLLKCRGKTDVKT